MVKELSCVIVDDEEQNRIVLQKMIDRFCPTVEVLGLAGSVSEASELLKMYNPDILFLDIEMPEENGFQLLDKIENPDISVVFTTAHADYALKAIKYAAMDYLLKPINLIELKMAIQKAINLKYSRISGSADLATKFEVFRDNKLDVNVSFKKIALPTSEGIEMVNLADIIWCQAQKNQTKFCLTNGTFITVNELLKEYDALLPGSKFKRVHKSHIVNIDHIAKYLNGAGGTLLMSDNSEIEVAVRRKQDIISWLKDAEISELI